MAKEYYEYDTEKKKITRMKDKKKRGFLKNVDKWAVVKRASAMIASGCASAMINRYFKANLPQPTSVMEKVITSAGVYFVTGMVAEKVSEYVESEVDDWRQSLETAANEMKELDNGGN